MNEAAETESVWISRVAVHDDHQAFAKLVRLHQGPVRAFLMRLCADDWHRADDLAQETFWKAYRNIGSYRGSGRFLSWLFGIAWQLHANQQRGNAGRINVQLDDELLESPDDGPDDIDLHGLEHLLRGLRTEEQAVMLLHYRHGLTQHEVAVSLDLPLGTVKSLINRACTKLRRMTGGGKMGEQSNA